MNLLPTSEGGAPLQVGDFDRVDAAADPGAYVEWMDRQRRGHRDTALDALNLHDSDVALDLGCGTGVDLESMIARTRCAIGLDLASTMAAATRARVSDSSVAVADAQRLPLRDASIDACAARAVLIHVPSPESVLQEIARVLTPAARLVLSEPDHGSHVVATTVPDVFERIKRELGIEHLLIAGPREGMVHRAAVCAGACGNHLDEAIAQKVDLYLTGEMRHHDAIKAVNAGLTVVCTLHSNSERPVLRRLRDRLTKEVPGVQFHLSEMDRDPFTVA